MTMNSATGLFISSRKMILNLLFVVALSALTVPISAQTIASITGTVADQSGGILPNATVTVNNLETGATRTVMTDGNGTYQVISLPVGRYEMRVEKTGFKPILRTGINLTVGQEAVLNFTLDVGDVQEEVMISAEAPLVNTTTTQTSGLVGEREVKDLPLNGRSFDNLITLNPGTVLFSGRTNGDATFGNSFSVSGRRPAENLFSLNGIEYTGLSLAVNTTPGGVSGQLLGIDAIREFNVVKDNYSAEFGKRAGAQVVIVSMSGTNGFHGSVFEFLRNSALDARNFFDRGKVPLFQRNNFGFSAGGPIRKNKTFVFGNYEGFRQNLGLSSVAIVPDENARRGFLPDRNNPGQLRNVGLAAGVAPYFELWPLPNGRNLGDGTAESSSNPKQTIREDFFTVRLDHKLSDKDSLYGVYTFDDGDILTPSDNPFSGTIAANRNQVLSLEETHIFSPTLLNTFRLGFSRALTIQDSHPLVTLPDSLSFVSGRPVGVIRIGGGTGGGSTSTVTIGGSPSVTNDRFLVRNLFTLTDSVQIAHGIHSINTGFWIQRIQSNEDIASTKYGQAVFGTLEDFMRGRLSAFTIVPEATRLYWRSWEGAAYVQDSIRLGSKLTVNAGLRYEMTNGWNEATGRASNFIPGPDGVLLTKPQVGNSLFTENNAKWLFSPRLGMAWDVFGKGKTVIHSGFGIYYNLLDSLGFCCDTNAPFNTQFSFSSTTFPIHITPALTGSAGAIAPSGVEPDLKTPTVVSWSFNVEHELGKNLAVSIGYVGSHGYNGLVTADLNTAIPTILADGTEFYPAGSPRRNRQLANSRHFTSAGVTDYNALQLDVKRRLSSGLQLRANYTFSKSIDNKSLAAAQQAIGDPQNILDVLRPELDRGLSAFDVRHRFSFSGSYELPFGSGKAFLASVHGLADKLVGGWQLNMIVNLQSGFPFTPTLGFNRSRNGDARAPDRPNLVTGRTLGDIILGRPERWFDPTAFSLPAAGTYGSAGRNILIGPGVSTVDMSLFKNTRFWERLTVQFRAEAFNLLNRTNFGLPRSIVFNSDGTLSASAGLITNTSTTSRQIQFGLKLIW
jgi:hypothetical protein